MRRLARALAVVLAMVLVVGGAVGVAVYRRYQRVVGERSESLARIDGLRAKPTLSADDACWLIRHWVHHGEGRAGLRPLVSCAGNVTEVPGGLRVERVLTESDFLQGRLGHDVCLVRTGAWEVLGEASRYGGCRDLPAGTAKQIDATLRAELAASVEQVKRSSCRPPRRSASRPRCAQRGSWCRPSSSSALTPTACRATTGPGWCRTTRPSGCVVQLTVGFATQRSPTSSAVGGGASGGRTRSCTS